MGSWWTHVFPPDPELCEGLRVLPTLTSSAPEVRARFDGARHPFHKQRLKTYGFHTGDCFQQDTCGEKSLRRAWQQQGAGEQGTGPPRRGRVTVRTQRPGRKAHNKENLFLKIVPGSRPTISLLQTLFAVPNSSMRTGLGENQGSSEGWQPLAGSEKLGLRAGSPGHTQRFAPRPPHSPEVRTGQQQLWAP